jgi:hypothetical protein
MELQAALKVFAKQGLVKGSFKRRVVVNVN